MKSVALYLQTALLIFISYILYGIDDWVGLSLNFGAYLIFVLVTFFMLIMPAAFTKNKAFFAAPALYLLFCITIPFLNNSPTKPFIRAMNKFNINMTKQEIIHTMHAELANAGYQKPQVYEDEADSLTFSLNTADSRYNASIITVKLHNNRYLNSEFIPD